MKYRILATGVAISLISLAGAATPVIAQSAQEIRQICYNKHALTYTQRMNASEQRRIEAERKRLACIKSGGKS